MPRSRLGPLAIESKLGDHPSTSSVWRAIHLRRKKAVAVKVFAAPFGGTPESRQLFQDEYERLKDLSHPGIAKCFGGGFEETDAYLAYELIEGETLSSQLDRGGRLSWENALDIAEGLADALEYLHAHSVVHGAIVPDKVIISGFSPVLLDVRLHRFDSPFRSTRPPSGDQVARQAPELINLRAQHPNGTASTDLYSLGVLIYEAITGRLPIRGDSIEEVRENAQTQIPVPPASIAMDCPVWLDKLIMRLLEKDPKNRPLTATAVKMSLAEVRKRSLSRTGVAEHVSSGFSPLQITSQAEKDEARTLLGRGVVDLNAEDDEDEIPDATVWHDQPWFLIGGLVVLLLLLGYVAWPASEATLRKRAERLIAQDTRSSLAEAENKPLRQILTRFPDGPNAPWARLQIDRINVIQFLHQLSVKIRNDLPINKQDELLHKNAQQLAADGNFAEAIAKYKSMITVLGEDPEYKVAVDAARYQIETLQKQASDDSDAAQFVESRLQEAEKLAAEGERERAREILEGLVELYGENADLKSLIDTARQRLAEKP